MSSKRTKCVTHQGSQQAFTLAMPTYGEMKAIEEHTSLWENKSDMDRAVDKMKAATEDLWRLRCLDEGHEAAKKMQVSAVKLQLDKIQLVAGVDGMALDNDVFYWLLGEIDAFRLGVVGDLASKLSTNMAATSANASVSASIPRSGGEIQSQDDSHSSWTPAGPARPGINEWLSRRTSLVDSP